MTQDKSLNLSLHLSSWPSSVMVSHLDNGGLFELWKITWSFAELQFADSTLTLDHPSCSFVLDNTFNTPPASLIQPANLTQSLVPLQKALTPTSYFLTFQTSTQHNLSEISAPLPLTLARVKYSFYVFLKHSAYICFNTNFLTCNCWFFYLIKCSLKMMSCSSSSGLKRLAHVHVLLICSCLQCLNMTELELK